ncbi:hypothetical protein BJ742DRAFT_746198 [Cladochytrium replicatum]|nr:hypothetical protein BJ742DRAFT_746198 [Cladochytrium replicatum]
MWKKVVQKWIGGCRCKGAVGNLSNSDVETFGGNAGVLAKEADGMEENFWSFLQIVMVDDRIMEVSTIVTRRIELADVDLSFTLSNKYVVLRSISHHSESDRNHLGVLKLGNNGEFLGSVKEYQDNFGLSYLWSMSKLSHRPSLVL